MFFNCAEPAGSPFPVRWTSASFSADQAHHSLALPTSSRFSCHCLLGTLLLWTWGSPGNLTKKCAPMLACFAPVSPLPHKLSFLQDQPRKPLWPSPWSEHSLPLLLSQPRPRDGISGHGFKFCLLLYLLSLIIDLSRREILSCSLLYSKHQT